MALPLHLAELCGSCSATRGRRERIANAAGLSRDWRKIRACAHSPRAPTSTPSLRQPAAALKCCDAVALDSGQFLGVCRYRFAQRFGLLGGAKRNTVKRGGGWQSLPPRVRLCEAMRFNTALLERRKTPLVFIQLNQQKRPVMLPKLTTTSWMNGCPSYFPDAPYQPSHEANKQH